MIVIVVYLGRKYAVLSQAVALNVGLTLVVSVCALIQNGETRQFNFFYLYIIADVSATVIATLFFDRVYEPVLRRQRMDSKKE